MADPQGQSTSSFVEQAARQFLRSKAELKAVVSGLYEVCSEISTRKQDFFDKEKHLDPEHLLEVTVAISDDSPLKMVRQFVSSASQMYLTLTVAQVFAGVMRSGKSCLISALTGVPLPSEPIPTTSVVCEVKFGPKRKAIIHQSAKVFEVDLENLPIVDGDDDDGAAKPSVSATLSQYIQVWCC